MPTPPPTTPGVALLVPVKAFTEAKGRLAGVLSPAQRVDLARRMATIVVRAGSPLPVHVVCDDEAVARWARSLGAEVLWRPGRGLNQAVSEGVTALHDAGYSQAVVAHADLPLATSMAWIGAFDGVTIVPDRRGDGTNAIAVPTASGFAFAYGPGSFHHHAAEARRRGLGLRVVRDRPLGFDVDLPGDLAEAADRSAELADFRVPPG